jgi:hypothetical protein
MILDCQCHTGLFKSDAMSNIRIEDLISIKGTIKALNLYEKIALTMY